MALYRMSAVMHDEMTAAVRRHMMPGKGRKKNRAA